MKRILIIDGELSEGLEVAVSMQYAISQDGTPAEALEAEIDTLEVDSEFPYCDVRAAIIKTKPNAVLVTGCTPSEVINGLIASRSESGYKLFLLDYHCISCAGKDPLSGQSIVHSKEGVAKVYASLLKAGVSAVITNYNSIRETIDNAFDSK